MNRSTFKLIGILQDYGIPYCCLFQDETDSSLYMFVRVSSPDSDIHKYVTTRVTPEDVMAYMYSSANLADMFTGREKYYARKISNGWRFTSASSFVARGAFKRMGTFNADLCDGIANVELHLQRIERQRPQRQYISRNVRHASTEKITSK